MSAGYDETTPQELLARKAEQQSLAAELGRQALLFRPLDELMQLAVHSVRNGLNVELAAILTLDDDGAHLVCRQNAGWRDAMVRPVALSADSALAASFREERPIVIDDISADLRFPQSRHLAAYGIRSAAQTVIRGPQQPVGVLAAHSLQERSFSDDDVFFLREIANIVAAAAARERADEARRRSDERLEFLAEAGLLLSQSLDLERTLNSLAHLVVPRLADWCVIHLLSHGMLEPTTIVHVDPEQVAQAWRSQERIPVDQDVLVGPPAVARTGTSELYPEITNELLEATIGDPERLDATKRAGMKSVLIVPLIAHGHSVGVLSFVSTNPDRLYGQDDLAFAEELARRAGLAVDNSRLHDAELTARGRAEQLQRLTARLAAALTPEAVLDIVLGEGIVASGAAAGIVALVEDDGETIRAVAARGYTRNVIDGWPTFPASAQLPVSQVVRNNEPLFLPDSSTRDRLFPLLVGEGDGDHALVALPLTGAARPLGGIALSFADRREFSQEERGFLSALAAQCGQALERALLHAQREERANAAFVLEHVVDGVFQTDAAGVVRLWNPAAEKITGVPAATACGTPIVELLGGWEEAAVQRRRLTGAAAREALPFVVAGRELWLSVAGVEVGGGCVYAFRDLTAEHLLEETRRDFVSTASHELRTPLASVYGAAQTLVARGAQMDAQTALELLRMIVGESERLTRILDDMLLANRIDSGFLEMEIKHVDVAAVAGAIVDQARARLPKNIALSFCAEAELPAALADDDRLRQVLVNLVDNAIKYSPDGGLVAMHVTRHGSQIQVTVEDHGLGIPPGELSRVFEKFYRLDPSMTRGVGGTGLGLYITRELVRGMDGTLTVESKLGTGSTFTVRLPSAWTR